MKYPKLANIPQYNLLYEFFMFKSTLLSELFKSRMRKWDGLPIRLPIYLWKGPTGSRAPNPTLFDWHGPPNNLLTLIVQRAILGIECFVVGAAWTEAPTHGITSPEERKVLLGPFSLGGPGTANNFYHRLPARLSPDLSLCNKDPKLYQQVIDFYTNIRNPLFHGWELDTHEPDDITPMFELIESLYDWVGTWHDGDIAVTRKLFGVVQ